MKLGIPFISSFRPGREGIHQVLGDLESGIMETLWISVNGLTGRQLCESLQKKKHLAYTTVLTVIDRLVNKGLIKKGKNPDNAYLYTAAIDKEKFTKEISDAVVKGLMEFSGKSALAAFVNVLELEDPDTIWKLEKLLKERKKRTNEL